MYIAGQKEMQQMDHFTIEKLGLPGVVLMENAGARVAEEIVASVPCGNPRILVLAGGGNNGGDGFVIARRLADLGMEVLLCLLVDPERIKGDAKIHFDVYVHRGLPLLFFPKSSLTSIAIELQKADLIVDAMLSTGVAGPLREPFNEIIPMVNAVAAKKPVIAVDIPSGVNSETGRVEGGAVKATKTVTFVFPKKGFFLNEGPQYVGEWKVADISVPPSIVQELGLKMPKLLTESTVKASVPVRPLSGHKGTFGHALMIGGSRQYVGAPIFAAKAALNAGAGLVTLAVPEGIYPLAAAQNPESLFLPLPEENGHFSKKALAELVPKLDQFDAIAIGPGMSRFQGGEEWLRTLIGSLTGQPIVLDADALYLVRNNLALIRQYKGAVLFTPHPGEMARLVGKTVKEVEMERIEVAKSFSEKHHVFLLLKGHRSIIAAPHGEVFVNPLGHDALGKGGSGDVLTGVAASFLAQGAKPIDALVAACFLHAKAGEAQAKKVSHYGVTPSDLIEGVREELNRLFL
ncbi:NAD(P)H-hydrate dehydratase [Neobacillus sp. SM06]|uniref:NAD(P)H-hydrate dehydratase n=1 Tax=Neobacillus sp. SM06 TaxID=3422492 RepID=UPI003D26E92F